MAPENNLFVFGNKEQPTKRLTIANAVRFFEECLWGRGSE